MSATNEGPSGRVLHGYIQEHPFTTPTEHAVLVARIVALAHREGYQLGKVFRERFETAPEAFSALVKAVLDDQAAAVAVPTLHHLAALGSPEVIRAELERTIGVPVLLADSTT